ncbi:patatin-domain-containing protein [Lindgomyces ingoldianus]|uniref:Patatin-domain-containing protein n=1 Tax=Lindgomyces ingoldianus TaxID=673940 RepID=A0ACB6RBV0_9PLEO|nr:patatin-domain-containing protein [Lindgomyces ingoldianus]KAF2476228.1 patatin-domain-containing protein [Lindgomyces ingoldianus]
MADVKKETDGPAPYSSPAFDFTLLPDYNDDFIAEADLTEFAKALAAPDNSPSAEDLSLPPPEPRKFITALNDWRPIHQRVRRRRKHNKPPRRGKDETREGFVYTLLKWPLLTIVFGWLLFLGIAYMLTRLYIFLYEQCITWRGRRQRLRKQLQSAVNYEEWIHAAEELDTYLGNESWKQSDEYAYYDSKTIRRVQTQMVKLRKRAESDEKGMSGAKTPAEQQAKAVDELRGLVEACIKNNFVGFENPRLYSETYYGTKDLVQAFVDEAEASLSFLIRTSQLDQEGKRAMFKHLSTNFGRTALCLSGGATFAYYHFGVAKALLDAALLPEVITGTSGGALVAGLLATRTDDELKKLLVPALAHRITACHDDMLTWFKRWYRTGARFDSIDWARRCAWFTRGSMTFREAYNRTGRILNVSCVPSDPHSPTILANYLTSPDCVIWSAVLASAAVPGILNPVVLMKKQKNGTLVPYSFGHKWKDGSLRTDIPLKALNLHFNVRFSIVSQVNPHINLFFFSSRGSVGRPVTHRRGRGWRGGFLGSAIEQYLKLDLTKWLKVLRHLELLPRPLGQDWSEIWLQRFSGTITIWPKSIPSDFYFILSDPSPQRLARMIHVGQQSAFPKLKFIANRAKLEHLIQQGRRQTRPTRTPDGGLANILSEDDLRGLLERTKSDNDANGGSGAAPNVFSGSESSSSASPRPGSPVDMPLGFSFTKQSTKRAPARLTTKPTNRPGNGQPSGPDSPSLSQRLSGWWSKMSPRDPSHPPSQPKPRPRPRILPQKSTSPPPASPYLQDRPMSMFELGHPHDQVVQQLYMRAGEAGKHRLTGSFLKEVKRQSRVFVDDADVGGSDDDDLDENELADFESTARRRGIFSDDEKKYARDESDDGMDAEMEDYGGDDEDEGDGEAEFEAGSEGRSAGNSLGLGMGGKEGGVM